MDIHLIGPGHSLRYQKNVYAPQFHPGGKADNFDLSLTATIDGKSTFVFDCAINAADRLIYLLNEEIKPEDLFFVASHGHYDHISGLPVILENVANEKIHFFGHMGGSLDPDASPKSVYYLAKETVGSYNHTTFESEKVMLFLLVDDGFTPVYAGLKFSNKSFKPINNIFDSTDSKYAFAEKMLKDLKGKNYLETKGNIFQLLNNTYFDLTGTFGYSHGSSEEKSLQSSLTEKLTDINIPDLNLEEISSDDRKVLQKFKKHRLGKIKKETIAQVKKLIHERGGLLHTKAELITETLDRIYSNVRKIEQISYEKPDRPNIKNQYELQKNEAEAAKVFLKNMVIEAVQSKITVATDSSVMDENGIVNDEKFINLADNSDILFCGTITPHGTHENHFTIEDGIRIAEESGTKKLVLTHLDKYWTYPALYVAEQQNPSLVAMHYDLNADNKYSRTKKFVQSGGQLKTKIKTLEKMISAAKCEVIVGLPGWETTISNSTEILH